jgi:hypothetical protein
LRGDTPPGDALAVHQAFLDVAIRHVVPAIRIAGIHVLEDAGDNVRRPHRADNAVEPDAILPDRPAEREARIPAAHDRRGRRQPVRAQLVVEVVALRPLAGDAAEVGPAEHVAAGLGHDVELRAAAIGFAEPSRDGNLDFLRVAGVVAIARDAAAVEGGADVHPVNLDRALVAAAAA